MLDRLGEAMRSFKVLEASPGVEYSKRRTSFLRITEFSTKYIANSTAGCIVLNMFSLFISTNSSDDIKQEGTVVNFIWSVGQ